MTEPVTTDAARRTRDFAIEAARTLAARHCTDVVLLDVERISHVCDFILIATGTSDRQMKGLATELKHLGQDWDMAVFRSNADDAATWIIADFVDVVVHLFEPNLRAYYDLEGMWPDAHRVEWRTTEDIERAAALRDDASDDEPAGG